MDIRVLTVVPLDDMRLKLGFSNGESGTFDVSRWMDKIAYLQPLTDKGLFDSVKPICHGHVVSWNEDIDFPADFLYENSELG